MDAGGALTAAPDRRSVAMPVDRMGTSSVKIISAVCLAVVLAAATPAHAQKVDLSTIKCKEFVESSSERIGLILMWLTGYFADEDDPPVIDFDEMKEKAKKLGAYCAINPDNGLMTAAEEIFG